jgi:tRNA threonylcarbamoyladenosine biosynthesis protein TsaE
MNKIYETSSADETKQIARELARSLQGGDIMCFYGALGSGKTTFMQGVGEELGEISHILSPTFIIMRSYTLPSHKSINKLYHFDLYRLSDEKEIRNLGIEDIMGQENSLVAIEWPEKMGSLLPQKRIDIKCEYLTDRKRKISITHYKYD